MLHPAAGRVEWSDGLARRTRRLGPEFFDADDVNQSHVVHVICHATVGADGYDHPRAENDHLVGMTDVIGLATSDVDAIRQEGSLASEFVKVLWSHTYILP